MAEEKGMVSVEVIPLVKSIPRGDTFDVAVVFHMEAGWHTYWRNPGDAGIPSTFEWSLPPGFKIVGKQEPVPTRHVEEGITTFIHEEEAIYLFSIQAPNSIPDTSDFSLLVDWLECKSICQAGMSQHRFSLPQPSVSTAWEDLVARALSSYPQASPADAWKAFLKKDRVELKRQTPRSKYSRLVEVDFFPYAEMIFDTQGAVRRKRGFRYDSVQIPLLGTRVEDPATLDGVLVQRFATSDGDIIVNTLINQIILP